MSDSKHPRFLLRLLLATTLLLITSPVQAASYFSTVLENITAIVSCTESQANEIGAIMANNTNYHACKTSVGSENLFNLTDPLVLCHDTACVAGFQTLYNDLPMCKYGSSSTSPVYCSKTAALILTTRMHLPARLGVPPARALLLSRRRLLPLDRLSRRLRPRLLPGLPAVPVVALAAISDTHSLLWHP